MINTGRHNLFIPEMTDEIKLSIEKYGENFKTIDNLIEKEYPSLSSALQVGELYNIGQKIYNSTPTIGDSVGWVNIRTGRFAKEWQNNKNYSIGDVVISTSNNGHYYRCVVDGTSSPLEPLFPTVLNDVVDDTYGILSWTPSTYYSVNKIVKRTSGSTSRYYKCITAGTSFITEPNWTDNDGTIVVDGSVTWMTLKKAVWKNEGESCEFRPFGEIY